MKKTAIFLILLLSIPGFSGCGGSQNPASAVTAEEGMTSAENGGDTDEKNWSSQEILSMFENVKEDFMDVVSKNMEKEYSNFENDELVDFSRGGQNPDSE